MASKGKCFNMRPTTGRFRQDLMIEHVYRFRSTASLLGKHQELKNQEIYCSPLEDLNDPMEGFKDLIWSGDKIVWMNLLKHYLLCLDRACSLFVLMGNTVDIDLAFIPVLQTENDMLTQEHKDVYSEICDVFFKIPSVIEYAEGLSLSSCKRPIRRDELCYHLRTLHCHALNAILTTYKNCGLMTDSPGSNALAALCGKISIDSETLKMMDEHFDLADVLFFSFNSIYSQASLIGKYNNAARPANPNSNLIYYEFPNRYVKLIEKIVHWDWYMACFAANYTNSSMWGHYADNHRGVCLKFKTGVNGGNPVLTLNGITGWHVSKTEPNDIPLYGDKHHQLHKITYKSIYPEIDFFRSLGRLSGIALDWWYSDGHGHNSSCAHDIYDNKAEWRERYWAEFLTGQTTKLADWEYEEEYRVVLMDVITNYSDPSYRKLTYKFSDLEGIIFGINTAEDDKLSIFRLVEEKCSRENRKDFEFYQAYYAKSTGKIDVSKLDLIKF